MSCLYCGGTEKLGTDHLIPSSRGGLDVPENLFRACRRCNASKSDRLPSEWRNDLPPNVCELERLALTVHPKVLPRPRDSKILKKIVINVRCTEEQWQLFNEVSSAEGLGVSTFLLVYGLQAAKERKVAMSKSKVKRTDKYESYRQAALAGGVSAVEIDRVIENMKIEDAKIDASICPRCGSKLTRALDPRQAGSTEVAGKWFNYRCTAKCGWLFDRCEPVGEN